MTNTNRQQTKSKTKGITALYSRLSREDSLAGNSISIENQMEILEKYAIEQGFSNIVHFCDDGDTGVRFDRDAWQELMTEVEAGNVAVCVLKDLSRWGRNYLAVGNLMEVFLAKGIRFIALGENIDSDKPETLEYAPFINLFNEMFARDTSKKIKTVAHARGNAGKPLSYNAIYGYKKSPDDKHKWIIDEPAAEIVRRIFQMTIDGVTMKQIARTLTAEKVEKPSYYHKINHCYMSKSDRAAADPYTWTDNTIASILRKPEYCGHVVNFRTYKASYKDKAFKYNPQEKWKIFHNVHEPIISQEVFDTVQRLRSTTRKTNKLGEASPLTGLLFCADCNAKLYHSRQSKKHYEEKRFGKVYSHKASDHYNCSTYLLGQSAFKKQCSSHFIRTAVVQELVLDTIRKISGYVRENEAEFVEKLRESSAIKQVEQAKNHKKLLAQNEHRIAELDLLFQKVYEDNATKRLSDERYEQLSTAYENEQAELKKSVAELQKQIAAFESDTFKVDKFLEIVKRYTEFDTLTTSMLNEFVEAIYVHKSEKTGEGRDQKEQQLVIHLNFIGHFEPPKEETPEPTAEELEAQELRRKKLEYQREASRRWYAKKKAEAEWQRALEAGEISAEQLEAFKQEQLAKEEAEKAHREKRTQERQEYAREWARKKRARLKAEREAQALLEPPDSEVSPEVLKERKRQRRLEKNREYMRDKRERERAEKLAIQA